MPLFAACCLASTPPLPTHCLLFTGWEEEICGGGGGIQRACLPGQRERGPDFACLHPPIQNNYKQAVYDYNKRRALLLLALRQREKEKEEGDEGRKEGGREGRRRQAKQARPTN
jgi:hypothetical protein